MGKIWPSQFVSEGLTLDEAPADGDYIWIYDVSAGALLMITASDLLSGTVTGATETTITVTTDYEVETNNLVIFASGTLTITLALASNKYRTKIANAGTGTVTIILQGADNIEGSTEPLVLSQQWQTVTLNANGVATYAVF